MCNHHSLSSYGQDVASSASPSLLGHAIPALSNSHTEWVLRNSSDGLSLLRALTPAPKSWGRSWSLKQSTGRASDSGVLVDIPNSSVSSDVCRKWLTERERLCYVCNPRSLKEGTETYVPSTQSLYLCCRAELLARLLSGNANMRRTCCSLNTRCSAKQLLQLSHANVHWLVFLHSK